VFRNRATHERHERPNAQKVREKRTEPDLGFGEETPGPLQKKKDRKEDQKKGGKKGNRIQKPKERTKNRGLPGHKGERRVGITGKKK